MSTRSPMTFVSATSRHAIGASSTALRRRPAAQRLVRRVGPIVGRADHAGVWETNEASWRAGLCRAAQGRLTLSATPSRSAASEPARRRRAVAVGRSDPDFVCADGRRWSSPATPRLELSLEYLDAAGSGAPDQRSGDAWGIDRSAFKPMYSGARSPAGRSATSSPCDWLTSSPLTAAGRRCAGCSCHSRRPVARAPVAMA